MDIKLVKNEKLNDTYRAREIHFIEIKVNKLENVDDVLAEKFIRDIVGVNFDLDFTDETWNDIKEIIVDKLNRITSFPKGFLKNDGTIIPLIANYVIEEIFNIELLSYSEDITDIEIVPKGFDSLFLDKDLSIFLCEYKSSISKLNEERIIKIDTTKIINQMHSLFIDNKFCLNEKKKYCNKYKECDKIEKLKVINLIVIRIPDDFDIKGFYKNIIKKIEGKISE